MVGGGLAHDRRRGGRCREVPRCARLAVFTTEVALDQAERVVRVRLQFAQVHRWHAFFCFARRHLGSRRAFPFAFRLGDPEPVFIFADFPFGVRVQHTAFQRHCGRGGNSRFAGFRSFRGSRDRGGGRESHHRKGRGEDQQDRSTKAGLGRNTPSKDTHRSRPGNAHAVKEGRHDVMWLAHVCAFLALAGMSGSAAR